jgi:hypothetical protein
MGPIDYQYSWGQISVYSARRMNIEKGVPIFPLSHLGGKDRHQPNSFQFPFPEDEREGVPYEEP